MGVVWLFHEIAGGCRDVPADFEALQCVLGVFREFHEEHSGNFRKVQYILCSLGVSGGFRDIPGIFQEVSWGYISVSDSLRRLQ